MRCVFLPLIACLAIASCSDVDHSQPVAMSVIGPKLQLGDPNRAALDSAEALVLGATAQGLVSFSAEGQIEPALAERWIMTDDGMSFIFRIRRTHWSDGRPVTASEVAARLRAALADSSRNAFKPLLSGVDQIVSMTGQVIEIRLTVPQPEFLQLMAQPEMAIFRVKPALGTGPYAVHSAKGGVTRFRLNLAEGETREEGEQDRDDIRVRSEPASIAIARFSARETGLVTEGRFSDLALVRASRVPASQFQVDPVYGLFGLAVSKDSAILDNVVLRRALAMAIDRDRIVRLFGVAKWRPMLSILPAQLDSSGPPAALEWVQLGFSERVARARALVPSVGGELRVAMPKGAGAELLFAVLAADWKRIGIRARRVGLKDKADLVLVDEVAPQSSALWYLSRISCANATPCVEAAETALKAAFSATTLAERGTAIAEADAAFASEQPFIPIALPLRWALVSPEMTGWRASPFGIHPLHHLRERER